jgi:hypothetical protein
MPTPTELIASAAVNITHIKLVIFAAGMVSSPDSFEYYSLIKGYEKSDIAHAYL